MSRTGGGTTRVALVSTPGENRRGLARYLVSAGFDVHECDDLLTAGSFGALVLLNDETSTQSAVANVRTWMKGTRSHRVLVVTSKPIAFKDLAMTHRERMLVLPAPVFGWDLVDALRSPDVPKPRGM